MIHVFDPRTGSLHRTSDGVFIDMGTRDLPFPLQDCDTEVIREAVEERAVARGVIPQGHTVAIFT